MSKNIKISATLLAIFAVAIAAIALSSSGDSPTEPAQAPAATTSAPASSGPPVVRASDARRLGPQGSSGVTFTEFLDFECESCAAAFPVIEQLRQEYAGRVTFVLRYFPIPSHKNAMNAAIAVEAAHQQGKLEAMYKRMYDTQSDWGEQQTSRASLFRTFAQKLGLNMKTYDADVKSARTKARVQQDAEAGAALGVQGTPSFFVNETRIEPQSFEDLRGLLNEAIAKS